MVPSLSSLSALSCPPPPFGTPILQWSMAFVGSRAPGSFSQFYCHPVYVKKNPSQKLRVSWGGGHSPPHPPPKENSIHPSPASQLQTFSWYSYSPSACPRLDGMNRRYPRRRFGSAG